MQIQVFNIGGPTTFAALGAALKRAIDPIISQVNALSNNEASATNNAAIAPPAVGSTTAYALGDFIKNSAPAELGTAGSKYLIFGWTCVAAGTPGTWKQCRFLTGN